MHFNVLNDIADKYKTNNAKNDSFAECNEESNEKDAKFKVNDHVRISKYKNIFAKGYAPECSEEIFVVKKSKNNIPWTYVISDLNEEETIGSFYEKERRKLIKKNSKLKK